MARTIQQFAEEADAVQNACNPIAIANSFAEAVKEMYESLGGSQVIGFSQFRQNEDVRVIVGAWLSKIDDLFAYPLTGKDEHGTSVSWSLFSRLDTIRTRQ